MSSLGDFDASAVVYGKFTTFRPSTGAAFTLAGVPVLSVYKDNSTTESTAGVTLTADFDARTGLNHFAVDTSADGTFYSTGSFFDVVITTGTVDSVSVVGSVVASFTIRKNSALKPTTAGRTLVVDASGLGDANAVKLGPTGAGTAQTARDVGASVLLSTGTGTGQLDFTSGVVKANATQLLGTAWLTPLVAGTPDVNAKQLGGTPQTGRDIGSSVLLSPGSGTGQLDFTSGVVKSNQTQLLGTALTETVAGNLAAALKKFLDVTTPVFTAVSVNQTGDSFARIGFAGVNLSNITPLDSSGVTTLVGTRIPGVIQPQTGDSFARIGALGVGLTAVTIATNNDKTGYSLLAGQLTIKKNTQITITFPMTDATTHLPKTGLTVTAQRTIDGAAVGACANAPTELSGGLYTLVLAATDVNGTMISLALSSAGADTRWIGLVTQA